jgi:hypothetical protein
MFKMACLWCNPLTEIGDFQEAQTIEAKELDLGPAVGYLKARIRQRYPKNALIGMLALK